MTVFVQPTSAPKLSPNSPPGGRGRQIRWCRAAAVLLGASVASLVFAACATERGDKRKLLERVPPPQPVLTASARYSHGAIEVQSWLGPSVRLRRAEGEPESGEGRHHAGGRRPRREDSSSAPSEYFGHMSDPFESGASTYSADEIDQMYGRVNFQYILPPRLALTLTVTNTGTETVSFAIADVNSLLGNFAPRPEKFVLAPGQQGSVDPMLSTFDNNFEELDLTLAIKCGDRLETQVLKLHRAPPPAPGKSPPD